jgi:hypothetical protein
MTTLKLNAIVTKALIDRDFQAAILNGRRRECLVTFGLSDDEIKAVLSVRASNLDQFIKQINALLCVPELIS